jgi:YfiH family protein
MNVVVANNLASVPFVKHGFFDRMGGASLENFASLNVGLQRGDNDEIVHKNRTNVANFFNVSPKDVIMPRQVHGNDAVIVDANSRDKIECDAIITNVPNLLIGIGTADCVPILLCDRSSRYIGAIHCGWRGAVQNIIENTFCLLNSCGCKNVECAIGPCIHRESFEVGEDIINLVDPMYVFDKYFDLPMYVRDKLSKCGAVSVAQININTCKDDNYFSYRRQNGSCGVQFSGILMIEDKK